MTTRPSASEVGDDQGQLDAAGDVEERRRLVEDEHRRLLGEGPGDEDALTLAVRQLGERSRPELVDTQPIRRLVGDAHVVRRQVAAPAGVWMATEKHDVGDGEEAGIDSIGEHHGHLAGPLHPVQTAQGHAVEETPRRRVGG